MGRLIQLGGTNVSQLTGTPEATTTKRIVTCVHLCAHTVTLVLTTADSVEAFQAARQQTGIFIGREYQGDTLETSPKKKPTVHYSGSLNLGIASVLRMGV